MLFSLYSAPTERREPGRSRSSRYLRLRELQKTTIDHIRNRDAMNRCSIAQTRDYGDMSLSPSSSLTHLLVGICGHLGVLLKVLHLIVESGPS